MTFSNQQIIRARQKADYSWARCGFPPKMSDIRLYVQWCRMVRWYVLNPSLFWGDLTKP